MRQGEGHVSRPTSTPVSCRLPSEQAQRMFEQADAAGLSHSDYLRALISDGVAAAARAVEAARQETAHAHRVEMDQKAEAVRVEMNQQVEAVRAELTEARKARAAWQKASAAWQLRAQDQEQHIWSTGVKLMTAFHSVLLGGSAYKPAVSYWLVRMPRDDPYRILPNLATQLVELLKDISDRTSTRRVDISRDRTKLRRAEWLVRTLSSEVGFSADGEAQPMADWLPAEAALDAAKRALEERSKLAGESR